MFNNAKNLFSITKYMALIATFPFIKWIIWGFIYCKYTVKKWKISNLKRKIQITRHFLDIIKIERQKIIFSNFAAIERIKKITKIYININPATGIKTIKFILNPIIYLLNNDLTNISCPLRIKLNPCSKQYS